ncbi:MAG: RNA 2',3'-cyclic phosphodiesterase [Oscillospiraceae bacterium]|nr:RNA 2',3'-cyclic phosphodiesterase [Oscillospiraceae bacterium]
MRLFIAIELPADVKDQTERAAGDLKQRVEAGRFPGKQNYHITLAFLGEVPRQRLDSVKSAMDSCRAEPFTLTLGGLGRFRRREGDVVWRKVEAPDALFSLQKDLSDSLIQRGFELESRKFTPHITLARGAVFKNGFGTVAPGSAPDDVSFTVSRMTLMESRLTGGKRVYTPMYTTVLGA